MVLRNYEKGKTTDNNFDGGKYLLEQVCYYAEKDVNLHTRSLFIVSTAMFYLSIV